MKITGFPIFRLFAIETHGSAKTPPRQLRKNTTGGESEGEFLNNSRRLEVLGYLQVP
jgi:hypothetical protein